MNHPKIALNSTNRLRFDKSPLTPAEFDNSGNF